MTFEMFKCHLCHKQIDTQGKLNRKDNVSRHQKKAHGSIHQGFPVRKNDETQLSYQQPGVLGDAQLYSVSNLMRVAASGDLDRLKTLLDAGLTVETRADDQSTALHCSARAGQAEVVKFLIDNGADIEARNEKHRLPIHEALMSKSSETVDHLFEQLPREKLLRLASELEWYLMQSTSISIVDAYITRLGDTFTNRKLPKKLHFAVRTGHTSLLTTLLDNPNVDGNKGSSNGHWETASLLLKHSESMEEGRCTSSDVPPISLTFTKEDLFHRLFKHPDFGGPNKKLPGPHGTILQVAIKKGDCEVIEILLACQDIDVNLRGANGWSPLTNAARYGGFKVAQLLLQHKDIDVNQGTTHWRRETALQYAEKNKHNEIVDLLLSHGAIDYRAKASTTVPPYVHIDNSQNTTLQPDHEPHFDPFDNDMNDAPTEAWEEFLDMEGGMEE
ncbi:hypothetical protein J4E85_011527 [Alternaria conjuncta]|uniref:uncharacterized protein n=1 Tax=Alternaria conjuncta TaxID=181017 RepID=UPI002220B8CF|nr:uncharacterized protein J4E85_011527 [Alternaria conjuncta]KAI4909850.1 hypothetical protein J4E85_011527 [Alternaria conjuncta]